MKKVVKGLIIALTIVSMAVVFTTCETGSGSSSGCVHVWDWVVTTQPTATEEGVETYTCLICGQTGITRSIPKIENAISSVTININAPVKGGTPSTTNATTNDSGYSINTVWSPNHASFLGGETYTAQLTLTADSGYAFSTGLNYVTVNGQNTAVLNNTGMTITLSYTFPQTPEKTVSNIIIKTQPATLTYTHGDPLDLTGLVVTLVYDDTTEEDVAASNFAAKFITANPAQGDNLVYSVHNNQPVTITYGSHTKSTNNFIVNQKIITGAEINITAPVKNAMPNMAATGTGNFTIGTVSWTPNHNPFLGGEVYTATVTLTAESGFSFTGIGSITIGGVPATVINNKGTTVTVTRTFSATSEKTVSSITIKQQLAKLTYTHGEPLDLAGLVVTFTYDDATTEDITAANFESKNINTSPAHGTSLVHTTNNDHPVTITYGDLDPLPTSNLTVNPKVITFTVDSIPAQTYTGSLLVPAVTVRDEDSTVLTLGIDYTVAYSNNLNEGTATITGIGNYAGSSGSINFIIILQTPVAADFDIGNLTQTVGSVVPVTITPKAGKSTGTITIYYNGSTTLPTAAGTYPVTFNVATVTGWNAATGLSAGTLIISNQTPVAEDFDIGKLTQTVGSVVPVTITPKTGKSTGTITIYYNGSTTLPTTAGTYTVTFNVAATTGWNAVSGLAAGKLTVLPAIEMVLVPGGSFTMGCTSGIDSDELPTSTVTLTGFYMGKYEVTQEQYQAVMGTNPSRFIPTAGEVQKRPVENLSWYSALVFCNRLSIAEGLTPAYRINGSTNPDNWGTVPTISNSSTWNVIIVIGSTGYRLPTEAQWEYAAKGGNGSPSNYIYAGSNTVDDVAWYSSNSDNITHEVGKKSPNGLGLYDMSGNVWEWCWDWNGDYTDTAKTNPTGADSGDFRVIRGGSYRESAESARSANRNGFPPYNGEWYIGFRLVRP